LHLPDVFVGTRGKKDQASEIFCFCTEAGEIQKKVAFVWGENVGKGALKFSKRGLVRGVKIGVGKKKPRNVISCQRGTPKKREKINNGATASKEKVKRFRQGSG